MRYSLQYDNILCILLDVLTCELSYEDDGMSFDSYQLKEVNSFIMQATINASYE